MTKWVFAKLDPAAVRRDPNETQLFKAEQAGEDEYAGTDALVREILQNSMDAGTGDGPVRVRLSLHGPQNLPPQSRLAAYFGRLQAPLLHRDIEFHADGFPKLNTGFLVCEDFGTRGLGGDPLLARDPIPGSTDRQDFFWFWRNIGRSGKTGDDLGRWGLGKTVYRAASQVGCMLGLTVRQSDGRQLLMGQAVLKIHELDDVEYVPEGFWCYDIDPVGLPLPVEAPDKLQRFRQEWKLTRNGESGLSVVVPYVASELTGKRLLQAVCVHFFLPIVRGELIVEIAAPDISPGEARLDSSSLKEWCTALTWDGPKRAKRHVPPPIDFIKSCLAMTEASRSTLVLGQTKLPEMNEAAFEEADLNHLREMLECEKLIRVLVRIALPRRSGPDVEGQMTVFLQRQETEQRLDTYYVREGMTITKLNSKGALKGIQALVLVDKGSLAQLLGDSEGPAHEDWDTSEERPNHLWKKWKGRVTFCRKIVDALLEVLQPPTRKADFNLLSDFFSVEEFASPQKARRPDANGEGEPAFGGIVPTPRWYRLDPRRGGFRIASSTTQPVPENAELTVSVAYDVPSGNPLKKWSSFDFDFQKKPPRITFLGQNVTPKAIAGNVLKLTFSDTKFSFAAEGFDQHTDLYVRIEEAGDHSATAEPTDEDDT